MSAFAPPGYQTIAQIVGERFEELEVPELRIDGDIEGWAKATSAKFASTMEQYLNLRTAIQQELYAKQLLAFYVDPVFIADGMQSINFNFWATDAGCTAVMTGRYFPLNDAYRTAPYANGAKGTTVFVKPMAARVAATDPNALPQKPGPKQVIDRIGSAYRARWPEGHKADGHTAMNAKEILSGDIGEGFSTTTFYNALRKIRSSD